MSVIVTNISMFITKCVARSWKTPRAPSGNMRCGSRVRKRELVRGTLGHSRVLQAFYNPRYAALSSVAGLASVRAGTAARLVSGCRSKSGTRCYLRPTRDISHGNSTGATSSACGKKTGVGVDRRKSLSGEGPALLQAMVLGGLFGQRMTVRYHTQKAELVPNYICQRDGIAHAERVY